MRLKYIYLGIASFLISFCLVLTLVIPAFDKRFDVFNIYSKHKELVSLGDEDAQAYIWIPASNGGMFAHWEINKAYAQQFIQDNIHWNLSASQNGNTWFDASKYFNVGLTWNDTSCGYKFTLTLNTTGASQAYYYRFGFICNKSLRDYVEINGWDWRLTLPANNTKDSDKE